jgi:hypothetical protein
MLFITALALPLTAASQAAALQAEDPEFATVEGAVINAQNSRTIPRASVVLQRMRGVGSKSVRADGNGHFLFQHVEPGQYKLKAERQGFYADESRREYQPVIEVAAGQSLKDVPVRLMPTAVVAGEIVDEYNDPLQNVDVKLMASRTRLGRMYLAPASHAVTDDRGQYRISGLRPGKYYVVAEMQSKAIKDNILTNAAKGVLDQINAAKTGKQFKMQLPPVSPDPPFTYPPLFYPATGDFHQAQPLVLNPGDEVEANFVFTSMPLVSITGRVTNGMTGGPAGSASVAAYWTEYMDSDGLPARVFPEDGRFEIKGVAPGTYILRASFAEKGEAYSGDQTVVVGPHGAQNVEIAALPDFAASGHVSLAGNLPNPMGRVLVEFVGAGLLPSVRASANYPEFKFEAQLRQEKRYYANVRNLREDYYLKSVAISGHEMPVDNIVVSGRRGNLELVLSPNGAEIDGMLFDEQEQPARGSILLVPDLPDPGPPELLRRAYADSTGKFSFRGVRPGTYRIVALESTEVNEELNQPDFARRVAARGESIIVEESGRYLVNARLKHEP